MAKYDYNLIVIGAGSAGLVTSYIAAAVKAKVALIERHQMGGDCLNTGCVPSKALIRSAKFIHEMRNNQKLGVKKAEFDYDFKDIMQRVQDKIDHIAPHDSIERYESLGVECFTDSAKLIDRHTVKLESGKTLTARSIVIATGARPFVPPIAGIDSVDILTSDNLWQLKDLPKKLVILGGGPIGCEMAQAFQRLGSDVTIVEMGGSILGREDADVQGFITETFKEEGVTLLTSHKAVKVSKGTLTCEHDGKTVEVPFDQLLVAIGRKANTDGLGLEKLGITLAKNGTIAHDAFLRTSAPNIFVCGDVAGPYQFTHTAAHQAWYAAVNALFSPIKYKADYSVVPWCTFTDPEVAHVGLNEKLAAEQGLDVMVTKFDLKGQDRAVMENTNQGFVKVITKGKSDKILGATIVGPHAGDCLAEFVLAMKHGLGLNKILGTIHAYPTLAEMNKSAAGRWKQATAPQWALRMLKRVHRWRR